MFEQKDNTERNRLESIMDTAMERMKALADADTIVGSPVVIGNGKTVIPVSKVTIGFLTGGGEYGAGVESKKHENFPFAGGSGGGISVTPIGFLIDNGGGVKMVAIDGESAYEKILGIVPDIIESFVSDRKKSEKTKKVRKK
ncbi:MAG: GerW family sporulation protein [Clostridiales bacterium]|jgi:sporulation protein YtfJ|nr:GerW family sporulation protein [Clostridiales bacterium]